MSRSPYAIKLRKKRAAILFMAVGALAVLSILALGTASSVMQQVRLAQFIKEVNTGPHTVRSLGSVMRHLFAADETPKALTMFDLRNRTVDFGEWTAEIALSDEQAKIHVGLASEAVLNKLPGIGGQSFVVKAIEESTIYVKEDLLLLDEVTPQMYAEVKDFITTFGGGQVNINTAGPEVLLALGLEQVVVDRIIQHRDGGDGQPGTGDDQPFETVDGIVPTMERLGLTEAQIAALKGFVGAVLIPSSDFVCMRVVMKRGARTMRSYTMVTSTHTNQIVFWHEE